MTDRLQLLIEADRRGLLPPEQKAMLDEAIKRGLVPGSKPVSPDNPYAEAPTARERLGRGFADVTEGIGQAARYVGEKVGAVPEGTTAAYTKEKTEDIKRYEQGMGPESGIDWMRVGGNVVATLPVAMIPGGAAASIGTRVAAGAAQGAAASGAMFTPEGDSKIGQMAGGAAVGGAVPYAVEGVKRAWSATVGRLQALPAAASKSNLEAHITAELKGQGVDPSTLSRQVMDQLVADAQKAVRVGADLDPAALARKADIQAVGGTPFKAAVTRNPKDWQEFQNLASVKGVGDDLVRVKEQNAVALTDALQRIGKGGKTPYEVGESVFDAVAKKEGEMQKVVGALYRKADDEFGKAMTAQPKGLLAAADEISVRADADPIITTINRYLTKRGILDKEGAVKAEGYLSLRESEELRKLIRDVSWDKGRSMRDIGNRLIRALDDDVFSGFPEGSPFSTARQAAAQKFDEFSSRTLQKILDDKVTPESFVQNVVFGKGKIDEMRAMQKVLTSGSKEQVERGTAAMQDIKGAVLDRLLMKATGATSADDVTGRAFSGKSFAKALDGIEWQKLNVLFSPKEIEALRQLQRASKSLTEDVPFSDVNYSRTGAFLANLLQKVANTPMVGALVATIKGDVRGALNAAPVVQGARKALAPLPLQQVLPGAAGGAFASQGQ